MQMDMPEQGEMRLYHEWKNGKPWKTGSKSHERTQEDISRINSPSECSLITAF